MVVFRIALEELISIYLKFVPACENLFKGILFSIFSVSDCRFLRCSSLKIQNLYH